MLADFQGSLVFSRITSRVLSLDKDYSPLAFHQALERLDRWFFRRCPDQLTKIAMVVARGPNTWEEGMTVFSKEL